MTRLKGMVIAASGPVGAHDRANSERSLQYPYTLIDSGTFGGPFSHHQRATKGTDDAFTC
jgi:hypothetical protein